MPARHLIRLASVLAIGGLIGLAPVLHGGALWLQLGSASQPALDADGAILTVAAVQALGVSVYGATGEALGAAALAGLDAAGPGFLVGVVAVPAGTATTVVLRLGPDAVGKTAELGEGAVEADEFTPDVDFDTHRIACDTLVWAPYWTLTYCAGDNGAISGTSPQAVPHGGSGTPVTAVPAAGYHFVQWSDGSTANPRTDTVVTASVTVTATFAITTYTVTFVAGNHGSLSGTLTQTVNHGDSTTPVTASPEDGYAFRGWSDGSLDNPRVLTVTADVELTASFVARVAPAGTFLARLGTATGPERRLWDLSGTYDTTVAGYPLELLLTHDTQGRLTGTATCTVPGVALVAMTVKGSVAGVNGAVLVRIVLRGADAAGTVSMALCLDLALDAAACELSGSLAGNLTVDGVRTVLGETLTLPVPTPMDGTWTLQFGLVQNGSVVSGAALLTLANGAGYACRVRGVADGTSAVLVLAGDPADPAAKGIRMRTTITPLADGGAILEGFSGRSHGQSLAW